MGNARERAAGKVWKITLASALTLAAIWALPPVAYPWMERVDPAQSLAARVPPPRGCERVAVPEGSFAGWLRHLPLKPGRPEIKFFDGRTAPERWRDIHSAVVDLDVGPRDLQQCADALIRLRAEYLWQAGRKGDIAFRFTSGDESRYVRWAEGYRPRVSGSAVRWVRSAQPDGSYAAFRAYLESVFTYAGSYSLSRDLARVKDPEDIRIGDAFVDGGFPGHASLVVDMAEEKGSGRRYFLLVEGYMPAQDVVLLAGPRSRSGDPWYPCDFGEKLRTPRWTFEREHLRRFPD